MLMNYVISVQIIIIVIVIIVITRGFPVTSLPCNDTVAEVWNTNLKVLHQQHDAALGVSDEHDDGCGDNKDYDDRSGNFYGEDRDILGDDDGCEHYNDYDGDINTMQVQALCMIEAPMAKLESGLLFKSFFTSVISNIFGVTRCYKSDCN